MTDDIKKYKQILQEATAADGSDPDKIAKYITISRFHTQGFVMAFTIPINDTFEIEDDYGDDETVTVTVTAIEMHIAILPNDSAEDCAPDGLLLTYDCDTHTEDAGEADGRHQLVKDWFSDGNYDQKVQSYLLKAGFSNAAIRDIEVDGMQDDLIEYYAVDIAKEMANAALKYLKLLLSMGASAMISKFGPKVLNAITDFTANDLTPHKHAIIKLLLTSLKDQGQDSKMVTALMSKLRNAGVTWPDLDVIEQGLAPDKLTEAIKMSDLNTASEKRQLTAVQKDGRRIQYIENPSEAVQLAAVEQAGDAIRYIKNPSEAVQWECVKLRGWTIAYIKNPGEAVQLAAVQSDGSAIQYIKNPSEALQLAAVQRHASAIHYIKNLSPELFADTQAKQSIIKYILLLMKQNDLVPAANVVKKLRNHNVSWPQLDVIEQAMTPDKLTETIKLSDLNTASEKRQLTAVKKDGHRITYIENPSEAVQLAAIQENVWAIKLIKNPSEAVQLAAVQNYGGAILWIKNPSEAVQLAAVQQDGTAIKYIENPSPAAQLAAVQKVGWIIQYIKNPSPAMQLAAVQRRGDAIYYITNPSPAVQMAAVQHDGSAIQWIKNPSPAVQLAAVQQNGMAIKDIENPNPAVQMSAVQQNVRAITYIKNPSPELFADAHVKQSIIKSILGLMKQNDLVPAANVVTKLRKHNVSWPQLDVIEQGLVSDKLTEAIKLSDLNTASEAQQLTVVKKDGRRIRYIENPISAVQMAAVQNYGYALRYIKNPSAAVQLAAVQKDGSAIRWIKNPSPAMQLAAVQQNGMAIQWIKNPSEAVQWAAVQQSGWAIRYIKNPSPAMQLAAVQQNGMAIQFIKNPSEAVQLAAVQRYGVAISHIKNPSPAVQLVALKTYSGAIKYIENPSPELFADRTVKQSIIKDILLLIKQNRLETAEGIVEYLRKHNVSWPQLDVIEQGLVSDKLTEAIKMSDLNTASEAQQITAVEYNGNRIRHISNPSLAVQLAAVQNYGIAIRYIENPSEAMQMAAVQKNGIAIEYIKNPSAAVQWAAIKDHGLAIQFIKNPSEEMKLAAVQHYGLAIYWIKNPSPAVQLAAIQQNDDAIQYIKNPSPAVQLAAVQQNVRAITYIKNPSPELFADAHVKQSIIKSILGLIKNNKLETAKGIVTKLRKHNVNWSQLDVIEQGLAPDKLTEATNKLNTASEDEQITAVERGPYAIERIKNPSELVQMAAVQRYFQALYHIMKNGIKNPSEAVQLAAMKTNGAQIKWIKNPSLAVQLAAVQQYGDAIYDIKNPSEAVQLAAVQKNPGAIQRIKNPSEAVQLVAVQEEGFYILDIKNPGIAVQMAAIEQNGSVIMHMTKFDHKLLNNPNVKRALIRTLLNTLKTDTSSAYDLLKWLRERNVSWPQLDVIEQGLVSDNQG